MKEQTSLRLSELRWAAYNAANEYARWEQDSHGLQTLSYSVTHTVTELHCNLHSDKLTCEPVTLWTCPTAGLATCASRTSCSRASCSRASCSQASCSRPPPAREKAETNNLITQCISMYFGLISSWINNFSMLIVSNGFHVKRAMQKPGERRAGWIVWPYWFGCTKWAAF